MNTKSKSTSTCGFVSAPNIRVSTSFGMKGEKPANSNIWFSMVTGQVSISEVTFCLSVPETTYAAPRSEAKVKLNKGFWTRNYPFWNSILLSLLSTISSWRILFTNDHDLRSGSQPFKHDQPQKQESHVAAGGRVPPLSPRSAPNADIFQHWIEVSEAARSFGFEIWELSVATDEVQYTILYGRLQNAIS